MSPLTLGVAGTDCDIIVLAPRETPGEEGTIMPLLGGAVDAVYILMSDPAALHSVYR